MANVAAPGGGGSTPDPAPGLPKLSTRALQLIDEGHSVWDAFSTAVLDHLDALVIAVGRELIVDIGEIDK